MRPSVLSRFMQLRAVHKQAQQLGALANVARDDKRKLLTVEFSDGTRGRFPYVWLRDNCPADHTFFLGEASRVRCLKMSKLDPEIVPTSSGITGDVLNISWPDVGPCEYPAHWLRERNFTDPSVIAHRLKLYHDDRESWNAEKYQKHVKFFDFERIFKDELYLHDALAEVCKWGLAIFENAKAQPGEVARLMDTLRWHTSTHFGQTFDIFVRDDPSNLGYTSDELEPHTDLTALLPEIMCIHYIQTVKDGGDSTFNDGLYAAEYFRKNHPEDFKLLSTVPIEHVEHGIDNGPFFVASRGPLFRFNQYGYLERVVSGYANRCWYWPVEPEVVTDVYRALTKYHAFVREPEQSFKIHMKSGNLVIFDNLRLQHGRGEYEAKAGGGDRRLQGCFFPKEVLRSRIRYLKYKHDMGDKQLSM